MDNECTDLLPAVCAVLADPRQAISDDTCLEKLLDWFKAVIKREPGSSMLQGNPMLANLLIDVARLKDPNPSILSFILRLTGLFAASEKGFCYLQEQEILCSLFGKEGVLGSGSWEDAIVRCGWVQGIHTMLQHQEGLTFIEKSGGLETILDLQRDSSLFVASAASQLLAHILSFSFLPDVTSRQPPSIPNFSWPVAAQKLIGHVENSLRLADACDVQRSLRLLIAVFKTSQPVVMANLWLKISGPIEGRLRKDLSNQEQLLVEMILILLRQPVLHHPTYKLWDFVSLALRFLGPTHALALALGIVRSEGCPESLRTEALSALLFSMEYVLRSAGQQTPHSGLLDQNIWEPSAIQSIFSRKSACVNFLSQSQSHVKDLLDMPSLSVPLPYSAMLRSVITVLQFCIGTTFLATPSGISLSKNLIGCARVQRSAVDCLGSLSKWAVGSEHLDTVFDILLTYLKSQDTDSVVFKKTLQTSLQWVLHLSSDPKSSVNCPQTCKFLKDDLFPVLEKRLLDVHWEVQDSVLEFITNITLAFKERKVFQEILTTSSIPSLLVNLLSDPESYVRASAITALGQTAYITNNSEISLHMENGTFAKENIVVHLLEILSQDSEGFPRRAAVKVFTDWLAHSNLLCLEDLEESAASALELGCQDLDWEVKLYSLELAEVFLGQILPAPIPPTSYSSAEVSQAQPVAITLTEPLSKLCRLKMCDFLFRALSDCDRPVAQKACSILAFLRGVVLGGEGISAEPVNCKPSDSKQTGVNLNDSRDFSDINLQDPTQVLALLRVLDVESLHQNLDQCSDHLEKSPRSLLQDILASAENTGENGMDCH
uniref:BRCA1 associated ATM activator 1 n=1 Tax=Latimeria chalumnae TaxID=7897 RepID=H3ANM2_LATCH